LNGTRPVALGSKKLPAINCIVVQYRC
jgi:hypothetical protein